MKRTIERDEQLSDDVLMSGRLLKKSDHLKQWRERWFWLTADGCMHYAKSREGLQERIASGVLGAFPPTALLCEISSKAHGGAAMWRFSVRTASSSSRSSSSSSRWQLSAASSAERLAWDAAIRRLSETPPAPAASSPPIRPQERAEYKPPARAQQPGAGAGAAKAAPKAPTHASPPAPPPPPASSPQTPRTPSKAESNRHKRSKRQEYVERVQQLRFFDGSGRGTAEDGEPMTRTELQGTHGSDLGSAGLGLLRMTWRRTANNSSTLADDRRHMNFSSDLGFDDSAGMSIGAEPNHPAARAANASLGRGSARKPAAVARWGGTEFAAPAQRPLLPTSPAVTDRAFEVTSDSLQLYVVEASSRPGHRVYHQPREVLGSKKAPLLGFLPGGRVDDDYQLHMSALQLRVNDDTDINSPATFEDYQLHMSAPEAICPGALMTPPPSISRSREPTSAHGRSRSRSGSSGRLLLRRGSRSRLEELLGAAGRVRSSSFGSSRSRSSSRSRLSDVVRGPSPGDDIDGARPRADSRSQIEDLFGDGAAGGNSSDEHEDEGVGPSPAKLSLSA